MDKKKDIDIWLSYQNHLIKTKKKRINVKSIKVLSIQIYVRIFFTYFYIYDTIISQDTVERVLVETGVGGVTALRNYYQEYILSFEENMKRKVEEMMERQRQLEFNIYSTNYSTVQSSQSFALPLF